jgi:hypothetical protein
MVSCTCGKKIDRVPNWFQSVKVEFVCNNCPNRQTKNIAFVSLEAPVVAKAEDPIDEIDEPDEEA